VEAEVSEEYTAFSFGVHENFVLKFETRFLARYWCHNPKTITWLQRSVSIPQ
jgi:hypothetical protein